MVKSQKKSRNRGFSLAEVLVALTILVGLFSIISLNLKSQRSRASTKGVAQLLAQELRQARAKAQKDGRPVALVFPSQNGTRPHSENFYQLEGYGKPKIRRLGNFGSENSSVQVSVQVWPVSAPATNELNPGASLPDAIDLNSWIPASMDKDYCFVFLPSGSLQTNDLPSFDGAFHLLVSAGVEYSAAAAPSGSTTMATAPSYFKPSKLGEPFTVKIEKTGEVSLAKGVAGNSGGVLIVDAFSPSQAAASFSPPPAGSNSAPAFDKIVVSPNPNAPPPGIEAQVEPHEHLTLTVTAKDPDGDELFCEWTGDVGHFSSSGETRMVWDEADRVRRSVWTWQPPHDAKAGDSFTLTCKVRDESGSVASPIVGSVINGAVEPPSKVFFIRTPGTIGHAYTCKPDGSGERRLTKNNTDSREIHTSLDSSRICYTAPAGANHHIEVSAADGSNPQVVYGIPGSDLYWARFNPQGTDIMFLHAPNAEIWMIDADGNNPRVVAPVVGGYRNRWASWSPDGTQIAYLSTNWIANDDRVIIQNVDPATNFSPTGAPFIVTSQPGTDYHYVEWRPDLADPRLLVLDRVSPPNPFVIRPDGTGRVNLPAIPDTGTATIGCWSPDGTQILYGTRGDGLYRIDYPSLANRVKILGPPVDFPVWRQ